MKNAGNVQACSTGINFVKKQKSGKRSNVPSKTCCGFVIGIYFLIIIIIIIIIIIVIKKKKKKKKKKKNLHLSWAH